jgi:hypothetical protein
MAEYLRIVDQTRLQTPVHRYKHPDTGRQVTLVATSPVADPDYFTGLRTLIDERAACAAVVHCEGPERSSTADIDVTVAERHLVDALHRGRGEERDRVADLGWATQQAALGGAPHWQVHDLSVLDIVRLAGLPATAAKIRRFNRMLAWDDGVLRRNLTIALRIQAGSRTRQAAPDLFEGILVERRNNVALDALFATECDTVLVWGAAHVPGLDAGIRHAGLALTHTAWRTAIADLPNVIPGGDELRRPLELRNGQPAPLEKVIDDRADAYATGVGRPPAAATP